MLSEERKVELNDRLDAAVEAQEKLAEAIELLDFAISGDSYYKSYILDQLRCRLDSDHGFLSSDVNIGNVIEWLEGRLEDNPDDEYETDEYDDWDEYEQTDEDDDWDDLWEEAEILKAAGVDYDEAFCKLSDTYGWATDHQVSKVLDSLDFPSPDEDEDEELKAQDAYEDERINEMVDWLVEQMKANSYLLKYQRRQAVYAEFGDISDDLWQKIDEVALSRYGALWSDEPNPSDFVS